MLETLLVLLWAFTASVAAGAFSLSVVVLWERRREPVVGYLWLFMVANCLVQAGMVVLLILSVAGLVETATNGLLVLFFGGQIVLALTAVPYSLALIGKMPAGPVRWLFGADSREP